ncbi:MAG TPA: hypothetical protein VGP63_26465, partial [Planctomycetaceae bacterium]|nr:hypothetical protein [Planctomycetaceae bacterium]
MAIDIRSGLFRELPKPTGPGGSDFGSTKAEEDSTRLNVAARRSGFDTGLFAVRFPRILCRGVGEQGEAMKAGIHPDYKDAVFIDT